MTDRELLIAWEKWCGEGCPPVTERAIDDFLKSLPRDGVPSMPPTDATLPQMVRHVVGKATVEDYAAGPCPFCGAELQCSRCGHRFLRPAVMQGAYAPAGRVSVAEDGEFGHVRVGPDDLFDEPQDDPGQAKAFANPPAVDSVDHLLEDEPGVEVKMVLQRDPSTGEYRFVRVYSDAPDKK
jgi:hypothetical protein